ncbi:hypothetical protein [Micromonospora sp. NPDC050276]|uniref:hypothetical protein n=1 Tax=Micromonospora sp. NPDC050276 TaxID=3364278 RepID=UPI0037AA9A5C
MFRRMAVSGVVALVVAGGVIAYVWWPGAKFTECQSRATTLGAAPLLMEQPNGVQPDTPYSGCDVDRLVAYAGRQYHGESNEQAIVSFYQQVAKKDAWLVTPSGAGVAKLCASKDVSGGTVYMNLSFPLPGTFDVHIADSPDSGALC